MLERIEQYQAWYDRRAVSAKARYRGLRCCAIVCGALVPVLVNIPGQTAVLQAAVTLLSVLVVAAISLDGVFQYREQWQNYRCAEQFLGHEKFRFATRAGCYEGLTGAAAFERLVERVEAAIELENAATLQRSMLRQTQCTASQFGKTSSGCAGDLP